MKSIAYISRAQSRTEARYPNLWHRVCGMYAPALGVQGSRLMDLSGNSNHGALQNMETDTDWSPSDGALALDFGGTNERVQLGANNVVGSQLDIMNQPQCTWFCRFRAAGTPGVSQALAGYWSASVSDQQWLFYLNASSQFGLAFRSDTGANYKIAAGGTYTANAWYNFAATMDGTNLTLYANDAVTGTPLAQQGWVPNSRSTGRVYMASYGDATTQSNPFTGKIQCFYLWRRLLTRAELTRLHLSPLAPFETRAADGLGLSFVPSGTVVPKIYQQMAA